MVLNNSDPHMPAPLKISLKEEEDIEYLKACIEQDRRTYNSRQCAEKLKQDRGVKSSPDRILGHLKKRGGDGKELGINYPQLPTQNTNKPNN